MKTLCNICQKKPTCIAEGDAKLCRENIIQLERILEFNLQECSSTPFKYKKDFYAKIVNELSKEYKELTGKFYVRKEA